MLTDAEIRSRYGDLPDHEILLVRAVRDATLEDASGIAFDHCCDGHMCNCARDIFSKIQALKEPDNAN